MTWEICKGGWYVLYDEEHPSEWLDKYNKLVEDIMTRKVRFELNKLNMHHIVPKSVAPELDKPIENHIHLPFQYHMDLHYYLWRHDPQYAVQLWFGCVWGRKHHKWDLPGGDEEYKQLKEDVTLWATLKKAYELKATVEAADK